MCLYKVKPQRRYARTHERDSETGRGRGKTQVIDLAQNSLVGT